MGSSRDALIAGSIPLTRPTNVKMIVATTTIVGLLRGHERYFYRFKLTVL